MLKNAMKNWKCILFGHTTRVIVNRGCRLDRRWVLGQYYWPSECVRHMRYYAFRCHRCKVVKLYRGGTEISEHLSDQVSDCDIRELVDLMQAHDRKVAKQLYDAENRDAWQ